MEKLCGIYSILNTVNRKRYIGLSTDIHQRWREHISRFNHHSHNNTYLQNSWYKYGEENFEFSIIELCDKDILGERERYYIEYYGTYILDGNGYNLTRGGEINIVGKPIIYLKDNTIFDTIKDAAKYARVGHRTLVNWCKEKRNYMFIDEYYTLSESDKQYYRDFDWESYDHKRLSKAHSKDNLSDETIKKLSDATKGKNNPRAYRIYCPQLDEYFDCAKDATDKYGVNRGSISGYIKGRLGHAGIHPVTGEFLTWIKV